MIWDGRTGELLLYRDRAGTKPLFYSTPGGALVFGSEPKALFCHPDITPAIDENSLLELLSIGPARTPGNGIFSGMREVLPGHYQIFSREGMEQVCYWDLTAAPHTDSYEKTVEMVSYLVRDAVKRQMVSDVPVCTFLSGGIDSSIVTALAARHMQKEGKILNTFSFDFSENEKYFKSNAFQPERDLPYVNRMLQYCKTSHTYLECSQEALFAALSDAVTAKDLPGMTDVDASLLYFCSEVAKHNKVTLTGECADEIFGGYNIYKEPLAVPAYDKIPFPIRRFIGKIASHLPKKSGINFLIRRGKKLEDRFIGNAYMFTEEERKKLLKIKTDAPSPAEVVKPFYDRVKDKDPVTKMQFVDLNAWMVGDILLKADKMSMANSLEVRVPFLDKKIMELAERIPLKYRVNDENTKFAMRKAALRRMPEKWAGKKKLGFPVPTRVWLKEDKYYNIVKEKFTGEVAQKYFNTDMLVKLLDDHKNGKADNSRRVWTVYTFLVWYDQFFNDDILNGYAEHTDAKTA